jgi:hypothetical protein
MAHKPPLPTCRFSAPTDGFVETGEANGSFGALEWNSGCWSSPVNQISKLHAQNLTLKLQTHSIFQRQLWRIQIAKASVS